MHAHCQHPAHTQCLSAAQLNNPSCLLFRTHVRAKPSSSQNPEEEQLVQMVKFWLERQTINKFPKSCALGQSYLTISLIPLVGKVGEYKRNLQKADCWESLSTQEDAQKFIQNI